MLSCMYWGYLRSGAVPTSSSTALADASQAAAVTDALLNICFLKFDYNFVQDFAFYSLELNLDCSLLIC